MSQNKPKKPILIREESGIRTFRDPETGEEFSGAVSPLIEGMERDSGFVSVKCVIRSDRELAKQLADLRCAIGSDVAFNNRQMLSEARAKGAVKIAGFRIWRAEQIVAELKRLGFSAQVTMK